MKNKLYALDIDSVIEIFEMAQMNGKVAGDSVEEEFEEYKRKHPEKFTDLGTTDKDIDLLTGDLRESGINVKNMNEEERDVL